MIPALLCLLGLGALAARLPAAPGLRFLVRRARPLCQRYYGNTALMTEREKRRLLRSCRSRGFAAAKKLFLCHWVPSFLSFPAGLWGPQWCKQCP